ncbi:MAG: hypothetical protein ACO1N7_06380 [Sphingobacteriaceae bacterium]
MRKFYSLVLFAGLLTVLMIVSAFYNGEEIRYFQPSTVSLKLDHVKAYALDFQDSISNDTLYQMTSREGHPIAYFRKIQTDICFDKKCRKLDIHLYWNITGRYLGFGLPEGEFLSKTDHEHFTEKEYMRLNEILANPRSPIAHFTYNQLVLKPAFGNLKVDGVTSATLPAVLDHIVQGAAYTTYKMWHIIYGSTQNEVEKATIRLLSPELVSLILESPDESDKMWALNHINGYVKLTPELMNKVICFIHNDNYSLSERAIAATNPTNLTSKSSQLLLLDRFFETGYSLKKLIIDKLQTAPSLNASVKASLVKHLVSFNGEILVRVLKVFKQHKINEVDSYRKIAELLNHENYFISKNVYDFLKAEEINDPQVEKALNVYISANKR